MKTFRIAKVLIKSMFKKPATLMYPVVPRQWQERTRGSIDNDMERCIVCGICARRCPADAIEVSRNPGHWTIHRMQCIQCGECVLACPKKCLSMNNQYTEPQTEKVVDTYYVVAKDEKSGAPAGDLVCKQEDCVYCGLCAKVCPADALHVDRKEKLWEVDKELCAKCGACVEKCPKKCLSMAAEGEDAPAADEKPAVEAAPEAPAATDDERLLCDLDTCVYCGLCAKTCPCDALTVDRKEKIWTVDDDACVKCGACVDKCPKKCLEIGVPTEEKEDAELEAAEEAPAEVASEDVAEAVSEDVVETPEGTEEQTEEKSDTSERAPAAKAVVDPDKCIYCGVCENECPCEAIDVAMDQWTLAEDRCTGCGACAAACPADAIRIE